MPQRQVGCVGFKLLCKRGNNDIFLMHRVGRGGGQGLFEERLAVKAGMTDSVLAHGTWGLWVAPKSIAR